jgi:hypothetical protein
MALWRTETRAARTRGARIEDGFAQREATFSASQRRVSTATERAEAAALAIMQNAGEVARAVARRGK